MIVTSSSRHDTPNGTLDADFDGDGQVIVYFAGEGVLLRCPCRGTRDRRRWPDRRGGRVQRRLLERTLFWLDSTPTGVSTRVSALTECAGPTLQDRLRCRVAIDARGQGRSRRVRGERLPLRFRLCLARYEAGSSRFEFSGFFTPVDNAPARNVVKAGRAVPVKFSLNGYQGLDILAAGSPASQQIACEAGATLDVLEETLTAARSRLTDAATDQYIYVWKTERAWANTCRQLVVTLTDGTSHVANFQLSN